MKVKKFNPISTRIRPGVSLIEASAGTGKTYTIAMLVLRFVVELDIPINEILVVTFTKAATEELKDRIRNRLADAKRALANTDAPSDTTIKTWLDRIAMPPELIKRRLELALLDIDQAGIYTIHGFCQRVLKEHALASGQLFDAELTEDLGSIKQACADDFWRRHVQDRPPWEVSVLTRDFTTPDSLLGSIVLVPEDAAIFPENKNLEDVLSELKQCAENAKSAFLDAKGNVEAYLEGTQFKTSYQAQFIEHIGSLEAWLNGDTWQFPNDNAFDLLTYDGLFDGLNGIQFKANKNQGANERKAGFLQTLAIDSHPFDELAAKAKEIPVLLRRNLLETLRSELDKQLEQLNVWSFDNLISHLSNALHNEDAQNLIDELRQRFQAVLIDEFQDTDSKQWHIFSSLFAVASHYLMLVGDPKQAIYKFRGADIYAYLEAQTQAEQHYTLEKNWRSHPQLVTAVNRLFQREHAFLLPDIAFHPVQPALTETDGTLTYRDSACSPLMLWQLPESGSKSGYWQANRNDAATAIRKAVADEIVGLLNGNYNLQPQNRPLLPQDIAILVRTNQQARDYQDALREAGVPSVLNSTESVFASDEAVDLAILLQAIAHPGDPALLGQALALNWFGYDGQTLYHVLNNEAEIDNIASRFAGYHHLWQQSGVMAMMQSLLDQEKIVKTLSNSALAERRITNLQHCLELLQQAVIDQHLGIHKTINWLKAEITKAQAKSGTADGRQLRLESDADAVKIITMHRAKGLEYPVVFCPYLWQSNHRENSKNPFIQCHIANEAGQANSLTVDLGSGRLDRHLAQAKFEEQAEDIRLAYVALTRAKYRCYVAWANVRTEEKPNESPLSWLLDFGRLDFASQQAVLQSLEAENGNAFAYKLLDLSDSNNTQYKHDKSAVMLKAKQRQRSICTDWQMSSYTALSALSALSLSAATELPVDKADEIYEFSDYQADPLPAGAHSGNVLHDLLEHATFKALGNNEDISELRDKACQRYGLKLTQPKAIDTLLYNTVATPLSTADIRFCLINVPEKQCLKEVPFYLSISTLNTLQLNRILKNQATFQPLDYKQMSGFLTGFIDLVCEYEGRFYVMDYKSNTLPDYRNETLTQAMREHNYGLQYWIYSVVLHRYLQYRLLNYRYSDHFGGVRYLFVRGMQPDIPMSGVFETMPDLATLNALAGLFEA